MTAANRGAVSAAAASNCQRAASARLMRQQFQPRLCRCRAGWDTMSIRRSYRLSRDPLERTLARALAGIVSEEIGPPGWRDTWWSLDLQTVRTHIPGERRPPATDHGHGSVTGDAEGCIQWLQNGRDLATGQIDEANFFKNRTIPPDGYRARFPGLFQRMFGLEQPSVQAFSPAVPSG